MALSLLLPILASPPVFASFEFYQCYQELINGTRGLNGAIDVHGNPVTNFSQAFGFTYQGCKDTCGTDTGVGFDAAFFFNQLLTWVLPWFALVFQLPYGANDSLKNLESMILIIGSPMLAAFSLALAVTSNRWMVERFRRSNHPHTDSAAKLMSNLQRVSFRLSPEDHVLPSLIALQENNIWWKRITSRLDRTRSRWTLTQIMSMVYVALTYALTWVAAFSTSPSSYTLGGQYLGSSWVALLPIVICNLQFTPNADSNLISRAIGYANKSFFVAEESGNPHQSLSLRPITIETASRDIVDEDRTCSAPIFFYTRIFIWLRATLKVSDAFDAASQHVIDPYTDDVPPRNKEQIIKYCAVPHDDHPDDIFSYDIANIFIKSTFLALFLQWGTAGGAMMAMYFAPPRGLGCYSASQLLYGCISTLVWLFCMLSSILAHTYSTSPRRSMQREIFGGMAVALRKFAKVLAALNVLWLISSAIMQFSNAYYSCYCGSSMLSLGAKAYVPALSSHAQGQNSLFYGGIGVVVASATALLFIIALNIIMKRPERPQPESPEDHD